MPKAVAYDTRMRGRKKGTLGEGAKDLQPHFFLLNGQIPVRARHGPEGRGGCRGSLASVENLESCCSKRNVVPQLPTAFTANQKHDTNIKREEKHDKRQ
jgi:hypothetical protein